LIIIRLPQEKKLPSVRITGLAVLFIELGQEVQIIGDDFEEAINIGVKEAYQEGYLRKSVVDEPVFERKNTKTNTLLLKITTLN
jgi:fumarate hydratase subunit alpha